MQSALDYAHPTTQRRRRWRRILLVIAVLAIAPFLLYGAFAAWFEYEMTRNGVVIMVDNKASVPVDAMLYESVASNPAVTLTAVAAGRQAERDQNTWRSIMPGTFRVQVGLKTYEGNAGYLINDDGPHRFWVKAFDDRVVVTRQSNESPWDLDMHPLVPVQTSGDANRGPGQ